MEAEHELDVETSSLAEHELSRLLGEGEADFGTTTVRLDAEELDQLLVKARRQLPAPRSQLTTQPYDQLTASALLDKDIEALDPEGKSDAELQAEAILELDDAAPIPDPGAAKPIAVSSAAKASDTAAKPSVSAAKPSEDDGDATPTEGLGEVDVEASEDVAAAPAAATPAVVAPDREPVSASIPPAGPPPTSPAASTPLSAAAQAGGARTSLPSAGMEWPGARERKRRAMTLLAIGAALVATLFLYFSFAESDPPAAALSPPPLAETAAPAPTTPSAQVQSPTEIDARKALDQLREGIGDCVRHAIGTLPGSSPAVPATLKLASGAGYTALAADWKTAVWSCAKFRLDAPMRFQLQWQSVKPGTEGLGLAWIDDDGDGDPDRSIGFRATAKGTRDVDFSAITPMEVRPVLPVR